jgi:voltage-gated potassium channel
MIGIVEPPKRRSRGSRRSPAQYPVFFGVVLLMLVVGVGTLGYLVIEDGWSLLDAFYMTVITITTVGYREVHPLTPAGQIFTSLLVVTGLGVVLYALARIAQAVFEGELANILGKRRMMNRIDELEGHYVICGFGKVGRPVAEGLALEGFPFVVVENGAELEDALTELGFLHLMRTPRTSRYSSAPASEGRGLCLRFFRPTRTTCTSRFWAAI